MFITRSFAMLGFMYEVNPNVFAEAICPIHVSLEKLTLPSQRSPAQDKEHHQPLRYISSRSTQGLFRCFHECFLSLFPRGSPPSTPPRRSRGATLGSLTLQDRSKMLICYGRQEVHPQLVGVEPTSK